MIQFNEKTEKITVTIDGDASDLAGMQQALIELMQGYDYTNNHPGHVFPYALRLLESLNLDEYQIQDGFSVEPEELKVYHQTA